MGLELSAVCKEVDGEPWLVDVDLRADEGLTVLAGPTLAGKTTTMRIAAGLERPTSGRVRLDDVDITETSVRTRDIGFVYQEFVNYPAMTVEQNIAAPLERQRKLGTAEIRGRVAEVAELLGLTAYLRRRPGELSGGQQQRVAIARSLAKRSRVLIFDEPLANLDYKLREELRDELFRIFDEGSSIVLYSTTEPVEALTFGANTVVMDQGRVLQTAPAIEAFTAPASAQVARVFSDPPMNLLPGLLDGEHAVLSGSVTCDRPAHLAGIGNRAVTFGIRPDRLSLRRLADDDVAVSGRLVLAELTGSETYLHVEHAGTTLVVGEVGAHRHPIDTPIEVHVPPSALYAFDDETGRFLAGPAHEALDG